MNANRSSERSDKDHGLEVTAVEPKERAERADRLLVVFNRDLIADEKIGEPVGWTPFTVEPAVEGTWKWNRKNAMEYRFSNPLPAGNRFP